MTWIVAIWSAAGAACLTLAWVHGLTWWQQRSESTAHLLFASTALSVACMAGMELWMQFARDPQEYALLLKWAYVPFTLVFLTLIAFVRVYLRAGRRWLFWTIVAVRGLALLVNFSGAQAINFQQITALENIPFLGGSVVFPAGTIRPLVLTGLVGQLLMLAFVADAAVTVWRRGDRRQALVVGGGVLVFTAGVLIHIMLLNWRLIVTPVMPSLYFTGIMFAMGAELSYIVAQAGRMARSLRESQLRINLAKSTARLALWTRDLTSTWTFSFSTTGRALHRLPAESTVTLEAFLGSFVAEQRATIREAIESATKSGQEFHAEGRLAEEGPERWLVLHGKVIRDEERQTLSLLGLSLDITERKQAELSLRQSAVFNRAILDSLSSSIAVLDRNGKILAINRNWEEFFRSNGGNPENCGVGANYLEVCRVAAVAGAMSAFRAVEGIQAVLEGRSKFFELEYPCEVPNAIRWFLMRAVPLQSEEGGAVISHSDISALRNAMQEKQALFRELEHSGRISMLGELSGSLAHELNQPLAAILANAQAADRLLARPQPNLAEIREILTDIIAEDKRAGQIVHRVRALARKETPQRQSLDLNQLVQDTLTLVKGEIIAANIQLRLHLAPRLPQVLVGHVELQQVLLNLLLNGLHAQQTTPPSERHLTIETILANDRIVVSVRDGGPGFSRDALEHLFHPFFTTKNAGMGLGLSFCRRAIAAHGGEFTASNHADGGAILSFSLPIDPPPAA